MGMLAWAARQSYRVYSSVADEIAKERRIRLSDGGAWSSLLGRQSYAGKTVTIETAMQLATVWACIKLTAQALSCMPLALYERRPDNSRVRVDDDRLAEVLGDSPNEDQTALEYWETIVAWLLTTGNAYSEKIYTGSSLAALQPISARSCRPVRLADGELVYRVEDRGKPEDLPRDKVFHVKGFGAGIGANRDLGLSPIAYGVQTFGSAIATDETMGRLLGSGMQASGILSSESVLKPDQRAQLQKIMEGYVSSRNAGKLMVLEAGMKYASLTLNPVDAQILETRRFTVEEICRWFGVPPVIIGHAAQGQTMWGSGVEQILISWLTLGIDPLADRIEARIRKQLIRPTGKRRLYAEFNREALLQMDSAAKANFLSTMVQNGLMDRNEGRAKLNLPNRDGADRLTAQTNLAPLEALGQPATDGNSARAALQAWLGIGTNRDDRT